MCAHLCCHECWFERIYGSNEHGTAHFGRKWRYVKYDTCLCTAFIFRPIWRCCFHFHLFSRVRSFALARTHTKQFRVVLVVLLLLTFIVCFVFLSFSTMLDFAGFYTATAKSNLFHITARSPSVFVFIFYFRQGNGVNSEELLDLRPVQHSTFQIWIERHGSLSMTSLWFFEMFCHLPLSSTCFYFSFNGREFKIKFNTSA